MLSSAIAAYYKIGARCCGTVVDHATDPDFAADLAGRSAGGAIILDDTDRELIRLLRANARQPNSTLAKQVGLSESACLRRIRLMEARGVIRGYVAVLDPGEAHDGLTALVTVTLERQSGDHLSRFEAAAQRNPEIRECYLMTGGFDYFLRVAVRDVAAYETLHTEVLSRLPGVARIQTSFAMRDALRPKGKRSQMEGRT